MAAQTKTMEQIRIILQHYASGRSICWIVSSTGASRNTVRGYISLVLESGQSASQALSATDEQIAKLVLTNRPRPKMRDLPFSRSSCHIGPRSSHAPMSRGRSCGGNVIDF
jgi:hypothetical protein